MDWYDAVRHFKVELGKAVYVECHIGSMYVRAVADTPYHVTDMLNRVSPVMGGWRWQDMEIDLMEAANPEFLDGRTHLIMYGTMDVLEEYVRPVKGKVEEVEDEVENKVFGDCYGA